MSSIAKKHYIFVIFSGWVQTPLTHPLDPRMRTYLLIEYIVFVEIAINFFFISENLQGPNGLGILSVKTQIFLKAFSFNLEPVKFYLL